MSMNDLYQRITDKILADMEQGRLPWEKPWNAANNDDRPLVYGIPSNAVTRKNYRGINVLLLWLASDAIGTNDMRFLTFKQARDCGGSVKRGEKSTPIYFFSTFETVDVDTGKARKVPMLRQYNVFHVSQTENCKFAAPRKPRDGEAVKIMPDDAADFIRAVGANVTHGGDRAFYTPALDRIQMPFLRDFRARDGISAGDAYRATLYHELTHWTGHASRMKRDLGGTFGSNKYAYEELIAELGGAFLCAEFGLAYQTQHAAYLQSWMKALKDDNKAMLRAASAAQKAIDLIKGIVLGNASAEADDMELEAA